MMLIRVVRRPAGESPDWVRDAWIGLSLPTSHNAPRTLRALSVLRGQANVFVRVWDVIRGRTRRVTGYVVNAKSAVDLLADTQPAAAEWWLTYAPKFLKGRGYFVFEAGCCEHLGGAPAIGELLWGTERFRQTYPASPGRIALLWVIATLVRIVQVMAFPGEELRSVSSVLYLSGTPVLAAFLAAWVLRLRGSMLHLVSALVMLDLLMTCISFLMEVIAASPQFAFWFAVGLYCLMIALLIGKGFAGARSRKRRVAAILLVIAAYIGAGALQATDGAFWQLSAAVRAELGLPDLFAEDEDTPAEIEPDIIWGAQPSLIEKQVAALRPRVAGTMNVYAMAVAGSGAQALFSREAHEALRVAALHYGNSSRGGALLSNGAADLMHAPLATRDNIAAVARGVGGKVDHRKDLLFLYLASHGSSTAELASVLSDYRSVQPISSTSTAAALRDAGLTRRVIVVSACFAATWIPALQNDDTIVLTAAAKDRTSFGCDDTRQMTLFGEAFLGSLMVKGVSLRDAFEAAKRKISAEEAKEGITPSLPQAFVGRNMDEVWENSPATANR